MDIWQTSGNEADGYTASQGGRIRSASTWNGRYIGAQQGRGANAAGLTALATHVRIHELLGSNGLLACGCPRIAHVLNWALPELYGGTQDAGGVWTRAYSWPAARTDGRNSTAPDGRLWMGQRVRLPRTTDVHSIASTPLARALLHAIQDYGIIVTDTAGAVAIAGETVSIYPADIQARFTSEVLRGRLIWQEMAGFPLHELVALPVDWAKP